LNPQASSPLACATLAVNLAPGRQEERGQTLRLPIEWQDLSFECVIVYADPNPQLGRISESS
jgi:hypothetical protein